MVELEVKKKQFWVFGYQTFHIAFNLWNYLKGCVYIYIYIYNFFKYWKFNNDNNIMKLIIHEKTNIIFYSPIKLFAISSRTYIFRPLGLICIYIFFKKYIYLKKWLGRGQPNQIGPKPNFVGLGLGPSAAQPRSSCFFLRTN